MPGSTEAGPNTREEPRQSQDRQMGQPGGQAAHAWRSYTLMWGAPAAMARRRECRHCSLPRSGSPEIRSRLQLHTPLRPTPP